jgi:hypothetical protein
LFDLIRETVEHKFLLEERLLNWSVSVP